jgi:hypothetical protein
MSKFEESLAIFGCIALVVCYIKFWIWLANLTFAYIDGGIMLEVADIAFRILPVGIPMFVVVWLEIRQEKRKK